MINRYIDYKVINLNYVFLIYNILNKYDKIII